MEFLKTQGNFIQYGPNAICYRGRSMKNRIQTLMNVSRILVTLVAMVGVASNVVGADSPTLDPHLEVLRTFLEKTWKQVSEAKPGSTNKPALDVARWERALNGKAVPRSPVGSESERRWIMPGRWTSGASDLRFGCKAGLFEPNRTIQRHSRHAQDDRTRCA